MRAKKWRESRLLYVRIPERHLEKVERLAEIGDEESRSMSGIVMQAIIEYVNRRSGEAE